MGLDSKLGWIGLDLKSADNFILSNFILFGPVLFYFVFGLGLKNKIVNFEAEDIYNSTRVLVEDRLLR